MARPKEPRAKWSDIAELLKIRIRSSTEQFLQKSATIADIPDEELMVLCKYLSISFVVEMFGGGDQPVRQKVNRLFKDQASKPTPTPYIPEEPPGIGGWKFCERLNLRVIRTLEEMFHKGYLEGGAQATSNAAKLLTQEAQKGKEYSVALMDAYQRQLLSLAEHVVEKFLPWLSSKLKRRFKEMGDDVVFKIAEQFTGAKTEKDAWRGSNQLWNTAIERAIRQFAQERMELLFAESLAENPKTAEAFEFSKDLIETFADEEAFEPESEDVAMIKAAMLGMKK